MLLNSLRKLFRIVTMIYIEIIYMENTTIFVDSKLHFYWHSKMHLFSIVVYFRIKLSELMSLL